MKGRFGDFEGDTIIGKNHKGAVATFNDRKTGFVCLKKLVCREASTLANGAIEILQPFKNDLHTLTVDNGKEFAKHAMIAEKLGVEVYFAHPYHS